MSYNHFEQEYILESSSQLEAAVKNNFPFDPSNDSDFSFKGNELNNEEENLHNKSTKKENKNDKDKDKEKQRDINKIDYRIKKPNIQIKSTYNSNSLTSIEDKKKRRRR